MGHIINLLSILIITVRWGYVCNDITVACLLNRRISYPELWFELEHMFGMSAGKMTEISWESFERVYHRHMVPGHPFRSLLISARAEMYT